MEKKDERKKRICENRNMRGTLMEKDILTGAVLNTRQTHRYLSGALLLSA